MVRQCKSRHYMAASSCRTAARVPATCLVESSSAGPVQADGAELAVAITAAALALADAGVPMTDLVAACSLVSESFFCVTRTMVWRRLSHLRLAGWNSASRQLLTAAANGSTCWPARINANAFVPACVHAKKLAHVIAERCSEGSGACAFAGVLTRMRFF